MNTKECKLIGGPETYMIQLLLGLLSMSSLYFKRKREYRKANGHGVFRTYWLLILTSPITLFILFCLIAIITGVAGDLPEMLELLIRGCDSLNTGAEQYWCNIS